MTWLLIKLCIRTVVFGLVFGFAVWRNEKVTVKPKLALPAVAIVFALLNVGLYWMLKPVLNLATLGVMWMFMPLILNAGFLLVTTRLLERIKIKVKLGGILTIAWLALLLTVAHGALYVVLDVLAA